MIILRKFASLFISLVDIIIWIIATNWPTLALYFFISGFVFNILFLFWVFYLGRKAFSIFWLILGPTLVFASGSFFYIFMGDIVMRCFVAVLTLSILWFLVEESVRYVYWPQDYKELSLENISSYAQLFIIFSSLSGLFYINSFIFVPLWLIVIIGIVITFFVTYQLVQVNHINNVNNWLFVIVVSLVMGELIWIINFFPTIYYINSAVMTIIFYLLSGLGRQILMETFKFKNLLRYLIVGGVGILIILFSSQWT